MFTIRTYENNSGKWYLTSITYEDECSFSIESDVDDDLHFGKDGYFLIHGARNDMKVAFCNGNKIIDHYIIPAEPSGKRFKQQVKKYVPQLEAAKNMKLR